MLGRSDAGEPPLAVAVFPRAIAGDRAAWDRLLALDSNTTADSAERQGLMPLLNEQAALLGLPSSPLVEALRARARAHVARDLLAVSALAPALDALEEARVPALLLKGVDVAHSVYPRSDLRPRLDSDLLVAPSARGAATDVLSRLGYGALAHVGGDLLMYQQSFMLARHGVPIHVIDLHWRIANPQRFGGVLSFDELATDAEPRPRLGPAARGLSPVHALLLACVHRVAHHFDDTRLIWTYDVHLLAEQMPPAGWPGFVRLALDRHAATACWRGLTLAGERFGTSVPEEALRGLAAEREHEREQEVFLGQGQRHIRRIMSDLAHLPSWAARVRLARQHAFPSVQYMRDVYAPASRAPLALLYARRVWRGARRWMVRS